MVAGTLPTNREREAGGGDAHAKAGARWRQVKPRPAPAPTETKRLGGRLVGSGGPRLLLEIGQGRSGLNPSCFVLNGFRSS